MQALGGISTILNCAGPFSNTAAAIVDACLATGTHYLDITGELDVIETLASRDDEAKSRGVVILPAVGFDVVPSDCLAVYLVRRLPTANSLTVAFDANTPPSHGTATTMLRSGLGALVREDGRLKAVPLGAKQRTVDFGFDRGEALVSQIGWGDLSTAYRSTGLSNIETYSAVSPAFLDMAKRARYLAPLLRFSALRRMAVRNLTRASRGPSDRQRQGRSSWLFAEVLDSEGNRAAARLRVPHPYTLTAWTSVEAAIRVAGGAVAPGFQTAGLAFGADFIMEFEGVERQDA
jgi:short subunit dehydrogenase-like uncharacterized protein